MKRTTQHLTTETLGRSETLHTPIYSPFRSPALESLRLDLAVALKTRVAGYGLRPKGLLGMYDPDTWQLKTAQISLFADCQTFLERLPNSGIMRNGRIYQAHSSVSNNVVKGYILLPTPTKADSRASGGRRYYFGNSKPGRGITYCQYIRDGENDPIYPNPELSLLLMGFPASYLD